MPFIRQSKLKKLRLCLPRRRRHEVSFLDLSVWNIKTNVDAEEDVDWADEMADDIYNEAARTRSPPNSPNWRWKKAKEELEERFAGEGPPVNVMPTGAGTHAWKQHQNSQRYRGNQGNQGNRGNQSNRGDRGSRGGYRGDARSGQGTGRGMARGRGNSGEAGWQSVSWRGGHGRGAVQTGGNKQGDETVSRMPQKVTRPLEDDNQFAALQRSKQA